MKLRNVVVLALCVSMAVHCGTQPKSSDTDSEVSYFTDPGFDMSSLNQEWANSLNDENVNPLVIGGVAVLVTAGFVFVGNPILRKFGFENFDFFHRLTKADRDINLLKNLDLSDDGKMLLRNSDPLSTIGRRFEYTEFRNMIRHFNRGGALRAKEGLANALEADHSYHLVAYAANMLWPAQHIASLPKASHADVVRVYQSTGLNYAPGWGKLRQRLESMPKYNTLDELRDAMIASATKGKIENDFDHFVDAFHKRIRQPSDRWLFVVPVPNWGPFRRDKIDRVREGLNQSYTQVLARILTSNGQIAAGTGDPRLIKRKMHLLDNWFGFGHYGNLYLDITNGNEVVQARAMERLKKMLEKDAQKQFISVHPNLERHHFSIHKNIRDIQLFLFGQAGVSPPYVGYKPRNYPAPSPAMATP